MSSWTIAAVPPLIHAVDAVDGIGATVAVHAAGQRAALVVVDESLVALGFAERVARSLRAAALEPILFSAFKPDPTCAQADAGAALARQEGVGAVVAVGGGSALDLGKAVAAIAPASAPAAAYALGARDLPPRPLPKICVPTTAGTGSEVTRTSVLSDDAGAKLWLWGDAIKADAVLLDPVLSASLPPMLTAATGIDALVHAIEAATSARAFAANDVFASAAIRLVSRWLPMVLERPDDLEARGRMLLAAAYAGIAIDNAGTAVAHAIGHALGSLVPVHHGRAVGVAMLASLPWNIVADDGRWAAVADCLGEPGGAAAVPRAFERLVRASGLEVRLDECRHLTPERLAAQIARAENAPMRQANRRPVGDDDLVTLARATLAMA